MARSQLFDLDSEQNEILLNPRWPEQDYRSLLATARKAQDMLGLKGHVWIATSGSTSVALGGTKLVALSKEALRCSAMAVNKHLESHSKDVWAQVLPQFHVGGLGLEVRARISGARVVSALNSDRWDADYFYQTLVDQKCTLSSLVPTQIFDLVQTRHLWAPESLRAVVVGGGAFESDLYWRARELGWPVLPSYGMTETASQIATASLASLLDSTFPSLQLLSHARARSSDDGFLMVSSESLLTSYARQETNQDIQIWDPKQDNWFKTEDRGYVEGKNLLIEGRDQDFIKIGGEATNIAHLRSLLEGALSTQHQDWVAKISLLDSPSQRLGAEIHLVTTLNEEQAQQVQRIYDKLVRPFEKIRRIRYVSDIPRTDLGKIKWALLRSLL